MIRVLVNGAAGRMGQLACTAIGNAGDLELVARCGRGDDLVARIRSERVDVAVDFTLPEVAGSNALAMVAAGARPIIGTSGLMPAQREELARRCAASRLGGVVAPNFAIGALLLMHFS
ncbi:MAG: 4-hydroxy-tetrahydrodipicolinate reductase, partial [Planctomycetes bacterium]|nr:4-hydroxy-tetrahydrodipicolinate reductase [Planctomycetota bacterium]